MRCSQPENWRPSSRPHFVELIEQRMHRHLDFVELIEQRMHRHLGQHVCLHWYHRPVSDHTRAFSHAVAHQSHNAFTHPIWDDPWLHFVAFYWRFYNMSVGPKLPEITLAQFYKWNPPVKADCSGLWKITYACVRGP
jgi:hypothetical protein